MTNIFNPQLLGLTRSMLQKAAFVDTASVAGMAGGGAPGGAPPAGAMPPGADPAAAGAMPPGADPAAAAAPPPAPSLTPDDIRNIIREEMATMQPQAGAAGGAAGAGGERPKMKVDVNTEIYHIKKLLTELASAAGLTVDPKMLQGDPAQDPSVAPEEAAKDPHSAAASMGAGGIKPIQPIQDVMPPPGQAQKKAEFQGGYPGRAVSVHTDPDISMELSQKAAATLAVIRKARS